MVILFFPANRDYQFTGGKGHAGHEITQCHRQLMAVKAQLRQYLPPHFFLV